MSNANELVEILKRAAVEAVEAQKPIHVYFGKVVSATPLKINVEQKMELGEKQLILSRNVTNFKTSITGGNVKNNDAMGFTTDSETAPVFFSHVHAIGTMELTVHNGLVVGEEVILIRQQGGQKFVVWDRIGT